MKFFNPSRLALMLGLGSLALPVVSTLSPAQAAPPRHAPAYGYRAKRTTIIRRTYGRPVVTRRYRSSRTITRTTPRRVYGRPNIVVRRSHR